jgi:ComEC/Rec2-related protein
MPLSYFRRPLFLLVLASIVFLCALRERLTDPPQPAFLRYRFYPAVALRGLVVSPMKEDHQGRKVLVRGLRLAGEPFRQTVLVHLPADVPFPGQTVLLRGRLRLPRRPRNPGEFDERVLLADRGVAWVFRAESLEVEPGPVPWSWKIWFWGEQARRSMERAFARFLCAEQARLAAGLTLGYKGPISATLNRAVQDAGVMHLLVPSGAKVAFVLMAALWCSRRLGLWPAQRFLAAAAVGGFYTIMVGGEAPYARAYLGGLVLMGASLLDRSPDSFQAMTLSALVILLYEPRQLFSAGFQMTYLAVLGLVVGMPRFSAVLPRRWPRGLKRLAAVAAVSAIVQLMLWPIFTQVFARGSVVGLLANLILVPVSGFLMAAGFLVWALSAWPQAAGQAARLLGRLLFLFVRVCEGFAGFPGAAMDLMPMSAASVAAYFLLVFALLLLPQRRVAAALAAGALLLWTGSGVVALLRAPALRLVILSLPRSRPSLLTFGGTRHWLVDPGAPAGAMLKSLRAYGVRRLDKVVIAGREDPAALRRLSSALSVGEVARITGLKVCQAGVCAEFGGPWGPRLRKGEAEYSIIASRLKTSAVEAAVDGNVVRISEAR